MACHLANLAVVLICDFGVPDQNIKPQVTYIRTAGRVTAMARWGDVLGVGLESGKVQFFDIALRHLHGKPTRLHQAHSPPGTRGRHKANGVLTRQVNELWMDSQELLSASNDGTLKAFEVPDLIEYYRRTTRRQRKKDRLKDLVGEGCLRTFVGGHRGKGVLQVVSSARVVVSRDDSRICVWNRQSAALLHRLDMIPASSFIPIQYHILMDQGLIMIDYGQMISVFDFANKVENSQAKEKEKR